MEPKMNTVKTNCSYFSPSIVAVSLVSDNLSPWLPGPPVCGPDFVGPIFSIWSKYPDQLIYPVHATMLVTLWKFYGSLHHLINIEMEIFIKLNIAQKRNSKCSNISFIFPFKILNTNSCARLTKCNKTSNMSHKEWVRLLYFVFLNGLLTLRIIPFVKTKKINRFFFLENL